MSVHFPTAEEQRRRNSPLIIKLREMGQDIGCYVHKRSCRKDLARYSGVSLEKLDRLFAGQEMSPDWVDIERITRSFGGTDEDLTDIRQSFVLYDDIIAA